MPIENWSGFPSSSCKLLTGIPARGLNDNTLSRNKLALSLCLFNHPLRYPIFHRTSGGEKLDFANYETCLTSMKF